MRRSVAEHDRDCPLGALSPLSTVHGETGRVFPQPSCWSIPQRGNIRGLVPRISACSIFFTTSIYYLSHLPLCLLDANLARPKIKKEGFRSRGREDVTRVFASPTAVYHRAIHFVSTPGDGLPLLTETHRETVRKALIGLRLKAQKSVNRFQEALYCC
jgi:hypothetical protein